MSLLFALLVGYATSLRLLSIRVGRASLLVTHGIRIVGQPEIDTFLRYRSVYFRGVSSRPQSFSMPFSAPSDLRSGILRQRLSSGAGAHNIRHYPEKLHDPGTGDWGSGACLDLTLYMLTELLPPPTWRYLQGPIVVGPS